MTATGPKECPNAVQNGLSEGGIVVGLVPVIDGELGRDDGEAAAAILEDFQQITALGRGKDDKVPVIQDQHVQLGDGLSMRA